MSVKNDHIRFKIVLLYYLMDDVILVKVLFDLQEQFCPSVNEYKAFNVFISVKKNLNS